MVGPNPEKDKERVYGLDHLRALAIVLVFFYHYHSRIFGHPQWLNDYAKFGWTGVDLFFVLSGYLISSHLFQQLKKEHTISIGTFYLKRVLRILPAFLLVLIIYICFPVFHEREALLPAWRYLTFTQNFDLDIKGFGTFSHAWSLCVEEHFYLLFPLLLLLLLKTRSLRRSYLLLIAFFMLGFVTRIYSWEALYVPKMEEDDSWLYWYKYMYYPSYNRLDGLLIGMSIAAVYNFSPVFWSKISKYGNYFLVLSLVVLAGSYFVCYEEHSYNASVFGFPLVAIGYGFMLIGAISPSGFISRKSAITTILANLSYGIYLSHKGLIHMTQQLFINLKVDGSGNLMLLLCLLCCIFGALLLNLVIERPFLRLKNKLTIKRN
jgi:peptidoglycan/LPS O-acetylase OafA/YrhL